MFDNFKRVVIHSLRLGIKDLLVFTRDRMMLISFIVMPIFMMVMMGFIFPSQNALKNAPLGVVNLDQGPLGAQIAVALQQPIPGQSRKMFEIAYPHSQDDAVKQIKKQAINGAIVIPADFSTKIAAGQQVAITFISDQSNPQLSAAIEAVMDKLTSEISNQLAVRNISSMLPGVFNPEAIVKPFIMQTEGVVPGEPNYFEFMAPGLMAMVIMMAAMTGLAASISREREVGTMDGIISAPISRLSIVLGKSFAQVVRGLLQAVLTLVLAMLLFNVAVYGNLWLLALLLLLTVFSFIGIGIVISALSSQQETAMTIIMTLTFPMMFLSGAFFPIQQMPTAMQWISKFLPITYAVEAMRKCIVLGTSLTGMMPEVWVMLGFGVFFTVIAIPVFNRIITR
jgi:ABC-2 type transport system permease protein